MEMNLKEKAKDNPTGSAALLYAMEYRYWLLQVGLKETYDIIITGSDTVYDIY